MESAALLMDIRTRGMPIPQKYVEHGYQWLSGYFDDEQFDIELLLHKFRRAEGMFGVNKFDLSKMNETELKTLDPRLCWYAVRECAQYQIRIVSECAIKLLSMTAHQFKLEAFFKKRLGPKTKDQLAMLRWNRSEFAKRYKM